MVFYFGTNTKMHQTPEETQAFVTGIMAQTGGISDVQRFVLPPYTSLPGLAALAHPAGMWFGAQNVHEAEAGEYTGEISARMLVVLGADLVMLGHAERRRLFGDTDARLQKKVQAALGAGLRVLLCVGENAEEKEYGLEAETVSRQLKIALHGIDRAALSRLLVAYEPVWSIGQSGRPATVGEVEATVTHIDRALHTLFGGAADDIPILYGGSVNRDNAAAYAALPRIGGLFVGRAAWSAEGYAEVLRIGLDAKRRPVS
jgi:triosephosphate isomerase